MLGDFLVVVIILAIVTGVSFLVILFFLLILEFCCTRLRNTSSRRSWRFSEATDLSVPCYAEPSGLMAHRAFVQHQNRMNVPALEQSHMECTPPEPEPPARCDQSQQVDVAYCNGSQSTPRHRSPSPMGDGFGRQCNCRRYSNPSPSTIMYSSATRRSRSPRRNNHSSTHNNVSTNNRENQQRSNSFSGRHTRYIPGEPTSIDDMYEDLAPSYHNYGRYLTPHGSSVHISGRLSPDILITPPDEDPPSYEEAMRNSQSPLPLPKTEERKR